MLPREHVHTQVVLLLETGNLLLVQCYADSFRTLPRALVLALLGQVVVIIDTLVAYPPSASLDPAHGRNLRQLIEEVVLFVPLRRLFPLLCLEGHNVLGCGLVASATSSYASVLTLFGRRDQSRLCHKVLSSHDSCLLLPNAHFLGHLPSGHAWLFATFDKCDRLALPIVQFART